MQKQAPSVGRILTMVLFALSCFGLLLFLWLSFGGPVPLKPEGYRFKVAFPEATQLGLEADVRVAGVSIGKVRSKDLDEDGNRTVATVEVDREYAPISAESRAILRQKTLLGETYVEITPGDPDGKMVREGGTLGNTQVAKTVELDEIFTALDPTTREAFRSWQQDLAGAIEGRGTDFNDSLGNLPQFTADGTDLLQVLDTQEGAVSRLIRNTGVVFGALTENEAQLRNLVTNSAELFETTAARNDALAESIRIFPTFLSESRTTLSRLRTFSTDTRPLVRELRPGIRELPVTLRATKKLAPDLRRLFSDLDPLIDAAKKGLPATRDVLKGAKPNLAEVGPFLTQLNPILQWLELDQPHVADFFKNGAGAVSDTTGTNNPNSAGHYLGQIGANGVEAPALYRTKLPSHRGNAYIDPVGLNEKYLAEKMTFPNWSCANAGGEQPFKPSPTGRTGAPGASQACALGPILEGQFPKIGAASYDKKSP